MSKRKPMDKAQARERRNRLLESAAAAQLSLTEGVREMRTISGMTQEEFARHREVSARVIKALELGQGNPTVATLNRIGEFFGLEVGFVPIKRAQTVATEPQQANGAAPTKLRPPDVPAEVDASKSLRLPKHFPLSEYTTEGNTWEFEAARNEIVRAMLESLEKLDSAFQMIYQHDTEDESGGDNTNNAEKPTRSRKKTRSS